MNEEVKSDDPPIRTLESDEIESLMSVGMSVIYDTDSQNIKSPRHELRILGWKSGQYIILEFKDRSGNQSIVLSGPRAVMRFLNDGRPCAMRVTSLDSIVDMSDPFFRVSWPVEVNVTLLRNEKRHELTLPCTANLKNDLVVPAKIENLSVNGCKLVVDLLLKVKDTVILSCTLPNGQELTGMKYTVCNVTRTQQGCICGCRTESMSPQTRDNLLFYLTLLDDYSNLAPSPKGSILFFDEPNEVLDKLVMKLDSRKLSPLVVSESVRAITWVGLNKISCLFVNIALFEQKPLDLVNIIRKSEDETALPIYLYGDLESTLRSKCKETGATGILGSIENQAPVIEILEGIAGSTREEAIAEYSDS